MDRKKPASLESAVEAQNSPDTFTYNGLGLRVGKTDSTGTYAYVCDGTSPGSPVLSDAHAVYNPGLSEDRAGVVTYSDNDALGNLWTLDAASGDSTPSGCLYTAFGSPVLTSAGLATPFRYGGGSGCQTDPDTGLVLMGHRYYDSRIGRFLSQDPAGDGDNWYAYCGNDPVNGGDPTGLKMHSIGGGYWQDDSSGEISYGADGADLSGVSSSTKDGVTHSDLGTVTIHIGGGRDITGPPDANNLGFGGWLDGAATFGTVTAAGNAWGAVDSGRGSRAAAVGLTTLAGLAVVAAAVTDGKDAAAVDATKAGATGVSRSVGELIKDFRANPSMWEKVRSEVEASINGANKGGTSLQEMFRHKGTAEELIQHTLFGRDGSIFEKMHFRGYWK